MVSAGKIRKVDIENRRFREAWTSMNFFMEANTKCLCLICGETVAVPNVENVKQYYTLKHASASNCYEGDQCKEKMLLFQRNFVSQYNIFRKIWWIEKIDQSKCHHFWKDYTKHETFSGGDFVKEYITSAIEILCTEKEKAIKSISLSLTRSIKELAENTEMQLNELYKNFEAIVKSTDITETLQLAIFVRAFDSRFNISEYLLARKEIARALTIAWKWEGAG